MTSKQLLSLLSFEERLKSVEIISQIELREGATFIVASLTYPDEKMVIPFIHYVNNEYLFTPCDWQTDLPQTPEEIEKIMWRVNNTEKEALMINGLPHLPII